MDLKKSAKQIQKALQEDDSQEALRLFVAAFDFNAEALTVVLRKGGILRPSKYDFRHQMLKSLVKFGEANSCTSDLKRYYESMHALLYLAETARSMFQDLQSSLRRDDIKNYFISFDLLFWNDISITPEKERIDYRHFTKEELAESFSFYYSLLAKKFKITPLDTIHVNEKNIAANIYLNRLADFSKLRHFQEVEIFIDCFNYTAERNHTSVRIRAGDAQMEMSIRLGYIMTYLQRDVDTSKNTDTKAGSLEEFSKYFVEKLKDKFFLIKEEPIQRIVLKLPMIEEIKKISTRIPSLKKRLPS